MFGFASDYAANYNKLDAVPLYVVFVARGEAITSQIKRALRSDALIDYVQIADHRTSCSQFVTSLIYNDRVKLPIASVRSMEQLESSDLRTM